MPSLHARHRRSPYCNHTFRVLWDGVAVAGVSHVSAIARTTEVIEYREGGGAPHQTQKLPGRTEYDAVTLERGVTHDATFEAWANQVSAGGGPTTFRKDVRIEVHDTSGKTVLTYVLRRCWPSRFVAVEALESKGAGRCLIESLTLQCERWERLAPSKPARRA